MPQTLLNFNTESVNEKLTFEIVKKKIDKGLVLSICHIQCKKSILE